MEGTIVPLAWGRVVGFKCDNALEALATGPGTK